MQQEQIARCVTAMGRIRVVGIACTGARKKVIEDAIASIQKDGGEFFKREYMAVKNYAGFGDQREDHQNGYGPAHGHVVFSVSSSHGGELGGNEVALLEAVRDFPGHAEQFWDHGSKIRHLNLCDVLLKVVNLKKELGGLEGALSKFEPNLHLPEEALMR